MFMLKHAKGVLELPSDSEQTGSSPAEGQECSVSLCWVFTLIRELFLCLQATHTTPLKKYGVCIKYSPNFRESIPKETMGCLYNQFFLSFLLKVEKKKTALWVSATVGHIGFIPVS